MNEKIKLFSRVMFSQVMLISSIIAKLYIWLIWFGLFALYSSTLLRANVSTKL